MISHESTNQTSVLWLIIINLCVWQYKTVCQITSLTLLLIMSFTGKYQLESQEGFEEFMKAVGEFTSWFLYLKLLWACKWTFSLAGLPDELIEKGKDIKSVSDIEQNGDHFKVTVTTGTKVLNNTFTLGQESELETLTGGKVKVGLFPSLMQRALHTSEWEGIIHDHHLMFMCSFRLLWLKTATNSKSLWTKSRRSRSSWMPTLLSMWVYEIFDMIY